MLRSETDEYAKSKIMARVRERPLEDLSMTLVII